MLGSYVKALALKFVFKALYAKLKYFHILYLLPTLHTKIVNKVFVPTERCKSINMLKLKKSFLKL